MHEISLFFENQLDEDLWILDDQWNKVLIDESDFESRVKSRLDVYENVFRWGHLDNSTGTTLWYKGKQDGVGVLEFVIQKRTEDNDTGNIGDLWGIGRIDVVGGGLNDGGISGSRETQ